MIVAKGLLINLHNPNKVFNFCVFGFWVFFILMMMRCCKFESCYAHWLNSTIQHESVCGYPQLWLGFTCSSCFYNPLHWRKKKRAKPTKQKHKDKWQLTEQKGNNCLKWLFISKNVKMKWVICYYRSLRDHPIQRPISRRYLTMCFPYVCVSPYWPQWDTAMHLKCR